MKIAVLFFGMSKQVYYNEQFNNNYFIDYEKSCENYKKYIFDYFNNKGYDIDVYFTTNILDAKDKKQICEKYNPVKYNFIENETNKFTSRNKKLINVIDLCIESGVVYDLILITRFDLLFQKDFDKSNINFDKFNLVSILENNNFICDNFYLFPYNYLEIFLNISKNNINKSFHSIKNEIYEKIGHDSVNFILNEYDSIPGLSFYKIIRNWRPPTEEQLRKEREKKNTRLLIPEKDSWVLPKKTETQLKFINFINNTPYKVKMVKHTI